MTSQVFSPLETRINGSFLTRYWLELFSNSAHFPIANILLELLLDESGTYLRTPDLYVMVAASLTQAYWMIRWQPTPHPRRFWGNLIGPALYTLIESLLEGPDFFSSPNHLAYWGFALVIGALQALRLREPPLLSAFIIVIESVIRASILFFMYAIFETNVHPVQTSSVSEFFSDTSHQFISLTVLFLGLSIGIANLTSSRYLDLLSRTSAQLRTYSEWLLGRDLLEQTFTSPSALNLTRRERTVLFMDIRNFTHWSEAQSPEAVVNLLGRYYQLTESILTCHDAIKFKLSADEVMAVFPSPDAGVQAALQLCTQVNQSLSNDQLGVGIGLHLGPVVEGLLGSIGVKFYDVIGDTVNTAKRIESAAHSGQVLISENVHDRIAQTIRTGIKREVEAKGKENPLTVYPLEDRSTGGAYPER